MSTSFRKHKNGQSGAFTDQYHELLGATPWIVIRRLLQSDPRQNDLGKNSESERLELSEGDIATVFSQFGEIVDVIFVRHRKTGKFLGTAYVKYQDYRSGILASDEMNSCFEADDCVLLTVMGTTDKGIVVERCEEGEIPKNIPARSYSEWLKRSCF